MSKYKDPITGDQLEWSEWVSWHIQVVIRRWTFFIIFACITAVCWIIDSTQILLWWNLCASALAIFIENAVGIAQWSQTKRDAQIIREIRELLKEVRQLAETDANASERELAVDLDTNIRITEAVSLLEEVADELGIEPIFGEWNYDQHE